MTIEERLDQLEAETSVHDVLLTAFLARIGREPNGPAMIEDVFDQAEETFSVAAMRFGQKAVGTRLQLLKALHAATGQRRD